MNTSSAYMTEVIGIARFENDLIVTVDSDSYVISIEGLNSDGEDFVNETDFVGFSLECFESACTLDYIVQNEGDSDDYEIWED